MQWDYKIIKLATTGFSGGKLDEDQLEQAMNELGTQEWELVSTFTTNQGSGYTRDVVAVFKRPRPN